MTWPIAISSGSPRSLVACRDSYFATCKLFVYLICTLYRSYVIKQDLLWKFCFKQTLQMIFPASRQLIRRRKILFILYVITKFVMFTAFGQKLRYFISNLSYFLFQIILKLFLRSKFVQWNFLFVCSSWSFSPCKPLFETLFTKNK